MRVSRLFVCGGAVREAPGSGNKSRNVSTQALFLGLAAGTVIDVRWSVLANTGSFNQRCLIIQKVGEV